MKPFSSCKYIDARHLYALTLYIILAFAKKMQMSDAHKAEVAKPSNQKCFTFQMDVIQFQCDIQLSSALL